MPDRRGEENPRVEACQLDIPREGTGLRAHVLDKGVYEKCARSAHPQSTESPRSNGAAPVLLVAMLSEIVLVPWPPLSCLALPGRFGDL